MAEKYPHLHLKTLWSAFFLCFFALVSPLHAQETRPDVSPPIIELEAVTESRADRSQVFTAQVVDDQTLDRVTLHFRRGDADPFERVEMLPLGSSAFFSTTLMTDPDDLRPFEYYVQAIDEAGNRTVFGFAFDPLRRAIVPGNSEELAGNGKAEDRLAGTGSAPARSGGITPPIPVPAVSNGRVKWWAIALGVVAVGTVAALAGDDGGGGSGGADTVPLRIQLQEP